MGTVYRGPSSVVCQLFFVAVTGCSKKLMRSAMAIGDPGMRPRHGVNALSQIIMAFILELASRWEFQPDKYIHMAFPSKVYVYQIFLASDACQSLAGAVSYSYFVLMWTKHCPHVRLKKAMRFTRCDLCVLATEALDHARANGGHGWESQAMIVIKRKLEEHYRDATRCKGHVTPPTTKRAGQAWRTALSNRKAGTVYNRLDTLDFERACGHLFCSCSNRVILALRCCLACGEVGRCNTQDTT